MKRQYLILLASITFNLLTYIYASEDTVDLSGLLPGGGQTFPITGTGTNSWVTGYSQGFSFVTTYSVGGITLYWT